MTKHTWKITAGGLPHTVELEHGIYSGKRILWVDGREIDRISSKWFDTGSTHFFDVSGMACELWITSNGIAFDYALLAGGQQVLSDRQQQKNYRPGAKVRQLLSKNDFYNDLARLTGLRRFTAYQDARNAHPYLAGEMRGYLVTMDTVFKAQPLEELLRVTVRCEQGTDDEAAYGQMEASPAFQNWLGVKRKQQPVHGQWQGGYVVLLSISKIPPAEATAQRIFELVNIISTYRAPRREYGCEMRECKGFPGDPVRLAFVQIDQVLMCDACRRSLPGRYEQAEQDFKAQPHHLERLALLALPVMPVIGLVGGGLSWFLHRRMDLFAVLGAIMVLFLLMPKLKVKFSLWASALVFLTALGTALASEYAFLLFYLVFRNYWTVTPALFSKAAEMMAHNATRVWSDFSIVAVLTGMWLAGSILPGYFRNRKRAFQPDVIVAGRVETFLESREPGK